MPSGLLVLYRCWYFVTNDVSVVGRMTCVACPPDCVEDEAEGRGSARSVRWAGFWWGSHLGRVQPPTLGPSELHFPLFLVCSPALSLRHAVRGSSERASLEHSTIDRHQSAVYSRIERWPSNADSILTVDMTDTPPLLIFSITRKVD